MSRRFQQKIELDRDLTAIDALAFGCGLSRSQIKKAMTCGAVWLKKPNRKRLRLRRAKHGLRSGDVLELYYDERILDTVPIMPELIEAVPDYSIWHKPSLLLSQGSDYGDHLSLLRIAEKYLTLKKGPYLVHRLDRDASGLILLAHSKKSAASFSEQFRSRKVKKLYRARVYGKLSESRKTFEINASLDGKQASSIVSLVSYNHENDTTELLIEIRTGRYHQIRRHLSMIGHPICNDRRYAKEKHALGPLNLCAVALAFRSPSSGEKVHYRLPDHLLEF